MKDINHEIISACIGGIVTLMVVFVVYCVKRIRDFMKPTSNPEYIKLSNSSKNELASNLFQYKNTWINRYDTLLNQSENWSAGLINNIDHLNYCSNFITNINLIYQKDKNMFSESVYNKIGDILEQNKNLSEIKIFNKHNMTTTKNLLNIHTQTIDAIIQECQQKF